MSYTCLDKWPGPIWEPVIHDGIFPLTANPGDIYINRHHQPEPLYYIMVTETSCVDIEREDIKEWVSKGLMKVPGGSMRVHTPVPIKKKDGSSSSKDSPTVLD